ncbi:MAG TPA: sigma-54-dependent Fis family transcriptional regulator, partial [Bacillaceae bacterium]
MQKVLVVGGGKGGSAIIKMLDETQFLSVYAVVDRNENAEGMVLAREKGISTGLDWREFLDETTDIVIEVTG